MQLRVGMRYEAAYMQLRSWDSRVMKLHVCNFVTLCYLDPLIAPMSVWQMSTSVFCFWNRCPSLRRRPCCDRQCLLIGPLVCSPVRSHILGRIYWRLSLASWTLCGSHAHDPMSYLSPCASRRLWCAGHMVARVAHWCVYSLSCR